MHYYTGKFDQSKDNIVLLATNLVWWVESSFHLFKEFYSEKGKELKTAFIIHWKGLNWYHNVSLKQPLYKPNSSDFFTCSNNKYHCDCGSKLEKTSLSYPIHHGRGGLGTLSPNFFPLYMKDITLLNIIHKVKISFPPPFPLKLVI